MNDELINEAYSIRQIGSRLSWFLLIAGLFAIVTTIATVTAFAMSHAAMPIWSAILIDPLLSIPLTVTIIGDSILARHGMKPTPLSTFTKYATGILALLCNVWASWGIPAAMMIHSIPVFIIVTLAALVPGYRRRFHDLSAELEAQSPQSPSNMIEYQTGPLTPDTESILSTGNVEPLGADPDVALVDTVKLAAMKDKNVSRSLDDLEWAAKQLIDMGELKPSPSIYSLQKTLNIGATRATELARRVSGGLNGMA